MKRKLPAPWFCLLALAFLLGACGGKYSDAKKLNEEYIEMMQNYIDAVDDADNAKDVAKAMDHLTDRMEKIWPKMKALSEKYPELKNKSNPPEEMKESQERAQEVGKKMAGTFMKLMPYMNDPEVQKAQKRLSELMMKNK